MRETGGDPNPANVRKCSGGRVGKLRDCCIADRRSTSASLAVLLAHSHARLIAVDLDSLNYLSAPMVLTTLSSRSWYPTWNIEELSVPVA